jgi:multidrug efflux pump subunit AcrA (membrane-fusion protein)
MSWAVPFAISAAISAASTLIQSHFAGKRQDKLEALAAERLRLQKQKATFESQEAQEKINRERRRATSVRRTIATAQGQTVEKGLGSSANLADIAIASSAAGASEFVGKQLRSTLALQQSEFDIATFDKTPGLVEQLGIGVLGAGAKIGESIGASELKTALAASKGRGGKSIWAI